MKREISRCRRLRRCKLGAFVVLRFSVGLWRWCLVSGMMIRYCRCIADARFYFHPVNLTKVGFWEILKFRNYE